MTPLTPADVVYELWSRSRKFAHEAGFVPAEAVTALIASTREILTVDYPCSKQEIESILCCLYFCIHWTWTEPQDRVFESMLELELAEAVPKV